MTALEAIKARRSIREFKNDPIEHQTVERLLEAAVLAPSAKNSQPWRFTVVPEPKREELLAVLRKGISNREAEGQDVGTVKLTLQAMEQAPLTILVHNADGIHPWKARKEHESSGTSNTTPASSPSGFAKSQTRAPSGPLPCGEWGGCCFRRAVIRIEGSPQRGSTQTARISRSAGWRRAFSPPSGAETPRAMRQSQG